MDTGQGNHACAPLLLVPSLMVPMPFCTFSVSCFENNVREPVQQNTAPGFSAFRALHFAGGLKELLDAVNQNL